MYAPPAQPRQLDFTTGSSCPSGWWPSHFGGERGLHVRVHACLARRLSFLRVFLPETNMHARVRARQESATEAQFARLTEIPPPPAGLRKTERRRCWRLPAGWMQLA